MTEMQAPSNGPTAFAPKGDRESQSLRTRIMDGNLGGYILIAPALVVLALLTIWPLIFSVGISFTDYHGGASRPVEFVGLKNYSAIIDDPFFRTGVLNTFKILVIAIPLQLILGYACARIFQAATGMIGSRLFRTLFIVPTMMSAIAIALFFRYILDPVIGVGNQVVSVTGLPPLLFFADPGQAFWTVIGLYLWEWVPFTSMILMAGLLTIPQEIYEAADIDGAKWHHRIRWIDLPLLRRVLVIAAILASVEVIRLFDLVYGATQGGPGTSTYTVTLSLFRTAFQNFETATAAAGSLMILVVTIFIAQAFVRVMREEHR